MVRMLKKYIFLLALMHLLFTLTSCVDSARAGRDFDLDSYIAGNDTGTDDTTDDTTDEVVFNRPTNAVRIATYCGCKGNKPNLAGLGCESLCSQKSSTDTRDILYLTFTVDPVIELNETLQDVEGWCTSALDTSPNPYCSITAQNDYGQYSTAAMEVISVSGNKAEIDITNLPKNQTFIIKIQEATSGAISTNSIQMRKRLVVESSLLELAYVPTQIINQFSCLINQDSSADSSGNRYFNFVHSTFFYYVPGIVPFAPAPYGTYEYTCFDFQNYGVKSYQDSSSYDRYKEVSGIFSLWNRSDPRFKDNWSWKESETGSTNDKLDIIDIIDYEVYKLLGNDNVNTPKDIFKAMTNMPSPTSILDSGSDTNLQEKYGYYLTPLTKDGVTTYCPDEEDYIGTNATDRALGKVLGIPTESLYVAEAADSIAYTDSSGNIQNLPKLKIYITKSTLDNISFYLDGGNSPQIPTDEDMSTETIRFYWPILSGGGGNRLIKANGQEEYRVLKPTSTSTTGIDSPDGKIGCVPRGN